MNWQQTINRPNGAYFCWGDLHVHTPAGQGFSLTGKLSSSNEEERAKVAKAYIDQAISREICLLGITEHNDVSWIEYIRNAATGTPVIVFPGFEVTANTGGDGVHLICLFDPNRQAQDLDAILSYFGLTPNKRFTSDKQPAIAEATFEQIVEKVKKEGGITIAAHATSNNGLLKSSTLEGGMRIKCFTNPMLLALEIPGTRNQLSGFEKNAIDNELNHYSRDFPIACINSSDAKSIEQIGTKRTFIKLSSFNIEGLRQAFLDWGSRIRLENEVLAQRYSRIIAAEWQGGFLDNLQIHFNENMNCLIGGRGTGKTTIVDTLRYVLDNRPRTDRNRSEHDEILKNVFRNGSKVSLLVESYYPVPKKYVIERIYPYAPVIKNESGIQIADLKIGDVFKAEVYGHKEIYEISKDPTFQFALLDRFTEEAIAELSEQEKKVLSQLNSNRLDIIQLRNQLRSLDDELAELPRLEERLERFASLEISNRLEEHTKYETEKTLIDQGHRKLEGLATAIQEFKTSIDLDTSFLAEPEIKELPNIALLREVRGILESLLVEINTGIGNLQNVNAQALQSFEGDDGVLPKWRKLYDESTERFKENLGKLQSEFPGVNLTEFIETETRVHVLQAMRKDRDKVEQKLKNRTQKRETLLSQLYENRHQQFLKRDGIIKEINKKLDGLVKIELAFEGYKEQFKIKLKNLKSGIRSEHIDRIVDLDEFSVQKLVNAIRGGHEVFAEIFNVPTNTALNLLNAISLDMLFEFEITEIPTKATIQLNLGNKENPNYREIDYLSAGQKCTALLALVLLESPNPLIIDQIEEDLDNTYIVEDIVQRLRGEKERRQFIITTHNANIPVLGDAELICTLEADNEKAYLRDGNFGSIDDENVKEKVEKTLEGGEKAFAMRKEKYGI
jgi:energy-coupling factor transporter ATP-binding protein EcfA2